MKIAISGASGFIGSHVREVFDDFVIIKRDDSEDEIRSKLQNVDTVINLAGEPIMQKWDEECKEMLYSSRIEGTKKLINAINRSDIKQFISTSAVGIYPNDKVCDENCKEVSQDFLGMLCEEWEKEANKCIKPTTIFRLGVVLGIDGGALQSMLPSYKMGLGGVIGSVHTMTSWIDIDDLMSIYRYVIKERLSGVFNAVSPHPVNNLVFTKTLGKILHRPTFLPLPGVIIKMIYGEGAIVLTGSKGVYPNSLEKTGFNFKYPDISSSLKHLLGKK
jgi:uncharacterized protein (TIGR01777 family)